MLKVMPAKMQPVDRKTVDSLEFTLEDHSERGAPAVRGRVEVQKDGRYLVLRFEGFGECAALDGHGSPVLVENWEGKPRVVVWGDINQEDPTHVIDLAGAKESNRRA